MITNQKYKNSVFRLLFNNKKEALQLYNNLYHTNYTDENAVELVTLDDVLFMPRKNDLAFLMKDKFLILLEHQSTINENMPLRFLLYVARLYEKILDTKNIYKHRRIPLPKPDFIVLYNGQEYSHFMQIVSDCRKNDTNLDTAMKQAIAIAMQEQILADFLKKHSSEVFNMLTLEYDEKIAREVELEEAREEGIEQGIISTISILKNLNLQNELILQQIKQQFSLSEEKAKEYLLKY